MLRPKRVHRPLLTREFTDEELAQQIMTNLGNSMNAHFSDARGIEMLMREETEKEIPEGFYSSPEFARALEEYLARTGKQ